ncbi:ABC transporter substrate-binding protein [Cohnella sp. GCM10027633]|uniref:ABC transporter substrate-binding protein n=1 Tax=unclassified Cohnella TaxID=2636738 RepID=UPI00363DB6FC
MVKSNKTVFLLTIVLVLSLVLTACSNNNKETASNSPSSSSSASQPANASSEPSAEPQEPVTLKISWWGGDTRHAAYQAAIEAFHKKYDWITVEPTFSGFEGYHDKLTVQLSTKNAPDVFLFSRAQTQNYGKGESLVNLYDHKAELPFIDELDSMMQSPFYKVGDKLLGVPAGIIANVIMYNKKVFDDTGVPYPTDDESWTSLGDKLSQVHAANSKVYGLTGWYDFPDTYALMMKQLGAEILDGSVSPPKATVNPDKAAVVWNWTEKLWADGTMVRTTSDTVGFEAGNLAAALAASSAAVTTVSLTPDPIGFAVMPKTFDGTGAKIANPPVPSGLWGVSNDSPHVKEALLLVNFLMTDKEGIKLTGIESGVPAVAESARYLSEEVIEPNTPAFDMVDVVTRSQAGVDEFWLPAQPVGAPEANAALTTTIEKYIYEESTQAEFIAESEAELNRVFKEMNP